ncbi:MAG: hypothetical protein SPL08_03290 [Pseudomonadota bacterium]|nr:hypothetical protein [Pseudomonadota bacterium]
MNFKKMIPWLVVASTLSLMAAPRQPCSNRGRRQPSCRPPCAAPAMRKPTLPCGTTKTIKKHKYRRRGYFIPPVPGHYHVHFERREFSYTTNSLESINYPYPTRIR